MSDQRGPNMELLLIEIIRELGHIHAGLHQLSRKVDYLVEVAGSPNDTVAIKEATRKLKASSDALDAVVKKTAEQTEP